ncbi:hypothetical protein NEIMUCOT_04230 [Neisseria mucosa ATCC 25996]|uniref:Uncharacterized protein n=1 Tax=Neisseria mucosa (strain ATCC 25996 / DSM 4631 / NCTC 10774 / M26) TaxID=546266 RepID=D2ZUE3_NEIM2|nr:hypothetical protein NEIMUCOT_04230 [Neisseria mucosa ATCC 25996]
MFILADHIQTGTASPRFKLKPIHCIFDSVGIRKSIGEVA